MIDESCPWGNCFSKGVWLGESLFSWKLFLTSCKRNKAFFSRAVTGHLSGRWIAELASVFTKQTNVIILSRSERERQKNLHKYKATYSIKAANQGREKAEYKTVRESFNKSELHNLRLA